MTDDFKKLFDDIKRALLSAHERSAMREELKLFMVEHPARAPFRVRIFGSSQSAFDPASISSLRLHPVALSLVLILCVGVGTSYAAEGALPGDSLYPVKIHVNESIRSAFAVSNEAKANWNATRISRRLGEAETLAADYRLTPATSAQIESSITDTGKDFDTTILALATAGDNASGIAAAQSEFEATLAAHAHVLSSLTEALPDSKSEITPLLRSVVARAEGAARARGQAERVLIAKNTDEVRAAAVGKKHTAEGSVADIRALAVEASTTLGVTTGEETSMHAFGAQQAIQAGNDHLDRGEYGKAFRTFQAALRETTQTKLTVDARTHLKDRVDLPTLSASGIASSSIDADIDAAASADAPATAATDTVHTLEL